jgi:adenylate cyclase
LPDKAAGVDQKQNSEKWKKHDKSSLIDILGYSMNISAKITSLSYPNTITTGEDIYNTLNPQMRTKFKEVNTLQTLCR